jgi:uncharacterized protein YigA (DUF484 family)
MSALSVTEEEVVAFLKGTPAFFERHAALLSDLTLQCPHGGQAISLPQRQAAVLREKLKAQEARLAHLVAYAHENEAIESQLWQWVTPLLAQKQEALLPGQLTAGLAEVFALDDAKLRVYGLNEPFQNCAFAQSSSHTLASVWGEGVLGTTPRCYSRDDEMGRGFDSPAVVQVLPWLAQADSIGSLAMIPITLRADMHAVLVLASQDTQRFQAHLAVDFLVHIGGLAQAALSRLPGVSS